jgi:hypothetical protein
MADTENKVEAMAVVAADTGTSTARIRRRINNHPEDDKNKHQHH